MSRINCCSQDYIFDVDETRSEPGADQSEANSKGDQQFGEVQRRVRDLLSDSEESNESLGSSLVDVHDENTEAPHYSDPDSEDSDMKVILSALEKSSACPNSKRQNKTFSEDKIRDIERTNSILMKRILFHSKRATRFNPAPKNEKISSAALNRRKQQRQIDHDNLILLRKILTVKPFVANHSKIKSLFN